MSGCEHNGIHITSVNFGVNRIIRFRSTYVSSFGSFFTRLRPLFSSTINELRNQQHYRSILPYIQFLGDSRQHRAVNIVQANAVGILLDLELETPGNGIGYFEILCRTFPVVENNNSTSNDSGVASKSSSSHDEMKR